MERRTYFTHLFWTKYMIFDLSAQILKELNVPNNFWQNSQNWGFFRFLFLFVSIGNSFSVQLLNVNSLTLSRERCLSNRKWWQLNAPTIIVGKCGNVMSSCYAMSCRITLVVEQEHQTEEQPKRGENVKTFCLFQQPYTLEKLSWHTEQK